MAKRLPQLEEYRQSTLRAMEVCPRRTMHALRNDPDTTTGWVGQTDDLGTMTHQACAEIMRTLHRYGEPQMSTEEAMVIAREQYAASPIVLSATEHEDYCWMVREFASYKWRPERILAIEEPLRLDIECPDGQVRTLKGTPDLVVADPPRGLHCTDLKSGRSRPRSPRQMPAEGEPIVGKEYLSGNGLFQRRVYGCLLLHRYTVASYVDLLELPLRYPGEPPRMARMERAELEHVIPWIGAHMMKLEQALREGPRSKLWKARPGKHCAKCEVARTCPIPAEQRGDGALNSVDRMDKAARAFIQLDAKRSQLRDQLKAAHEETGHYAEVGDGTVIGWNPPVGKGRKFGPFVPTGQQETAA